MSHLKSLTLTIAPHQIERNPKLIRRQRLIERLEEQRQGLRRELGSDGDVSNAADRAGVETRIKELDGRISAADQQLAKADAAVAQAAALPGAAVEPPRPPRNGPPEELLALPIVFTLAVCMPIAIAYARRIWKRGATVTRSPWDPRLRAIRSETRNSAAAARVECTM